MGGHSREVKVRDEKEKKKRRIQLSFSMTSLRAPEIVAHDDRKHPTKDRRFECLELGHPTSSTVQALRLPGPAPHGLAYDAYMSSTSPYPTYRQAAR